MQGVADRDQIVVQRVRTRGLPIAIIAGGGYTRTAAPAAARSLLNLYHLGLISGPAAGLCRIPIRSVLRGGVLFRHTTPVARPRRGFLAHCAAPMDLWE